MKIETRYHPATFTLTYVVYDEQTKDAIIIDPVLDYDPLGSQTDTRTARELVDWVRAHELKVHYVLETHAHADHLTGAQFLRRELGAQVVIGEHICRVQETFKPLFGLGDEFVTDGGQFDGLAREGEPIVAGSLTIDVLHTPGHTPACVSYRVEDAVFTGDALFMPDFGTGRCDFPKGSADALYTSVHDKLYALPDDTRVFVGHDYQPGGRSLQFETSIGESKRANKQLRHDTTREEFVRFRNDRDATLSAPRLLFPSVQVNIAAGRLPSAQGGIRHLAIPLNLFRPTDDDGQIVPEGANR
jgi:glyoxylase-like metal-dependent hydrolase (beta-lactamase superfamily II)